jgi:aspartyl-tRNA(Asn)/glutamyl-tRNA(Gln) amidotransferase subunit A
MMDGLNSQTGLSRRSLLIAAAGTQLRAQSARPPAGEPYFWTLSEAADQLRKGKVSSEELTKILLNRIRRNNERLNAFITVTEEIAMKQARACDADSKRHTFRGALHGVPIALKDNIDTAGVLTTAAAKPFAARVPAEDAEVARRTAQAGAVMLGKLNLDEFAFAGSGTTGCFGPAHNPWNLQRITGGSSAGSAAALAAGLCFASVGSDDGGSVRIPGAHCGVVGFKPSYGRISTRGIVPSAYSLDCPGPMARTVEDVALMMEVLAGNDPLDAIVQERPVPAYTRALNESVAKIRVGVPRAGFFENLEADVSKQVEAAIGVMRPRVREVRDVTLPQFQPVQGGGTDIELYHYHRTMFEASPELYHASSRRLLERAKTITPVEYVETLKRIREIRRDVRRIFEQVDVLLLPTMRETAPAIAEVVSGTHRSPGSNVSAFNRFGLPALTVPCGFSADGLPIGLQVAGPNFGESMVLTVAMAYQQSTDWHRKRPDGLD